MLTTEEKAKIIEKYKTHEKDTGSYEIQIALLSREIELLVDHLQKNPKDFHSKRGLLKMIAKRRRLLKKLQSEDQKRYEKIATSLNLK
jgi:small subunit ribosomal protein S15